MIFGYAASFDLNSVPYAVYDQDHSAASAAFLNQLDGSGIFRRQADLSRIQDISTWIDSSRVLLVVRFDQDFERHLLAGQTAQVQIIGDGRNSNTAGTAMGYIGSIVDDFNANWRSSHGQPGPPLQIVMRSWYNPNLDSRWSMIPSLIGTLTMMGTLMLAALSVAREREQGTFDQLPVTPFRPFEIMAGKALPNMVIGLTQSTTILLIAQFWFHIPFVGSFGVLYAGLFKKRLTRIARAVTHRSHLWLGSLE
jgi:ABC-2 type transport system permease protein